MKTRFLLVLFLVSSTAKAVTIEQYCTNNLAGPVTSISCTLTDVEPKRSFWITLHYVDATFSAIPQFVKPSCLTNLGEPQTLVNTGNDFWFYGMMRANGSVCCSGTKTFTYNFTDGGPEPVTNAQIFVAQIRGLGFTTGNFTGIEFGTGDPVTGSLAGVVAGEFLAAWVSTSRGPADTFTAGAGYTLLDATSPDTREWEIAGSSGVISIPFTGATTAYWNLIGASFTTGADQPNVCTTASIEHRRYLY